MKTTHNVVWKSTDCLRHVLGAPGEVGTITLAYVCEFCKLSPQEDFL